MVHENVSRLRKAKGVTMTHLSKELGLSLQGYKHLETGSVRLDVERLKIIAKILSVNEAIFFDDELTETVIKELNSHKEQSATSA